MHPCTAINRMRSRAGSRLLLGHYDEAAVIRAAEEALADAGGQVSCGFVFVSPHWLPQINDILDSIRVQRSRPDFGRNGRRRFDWHGR